jgi:hypothetical protein
VAGFDLDDRGFNLSEGRLSCLCHRAQTGSRVDSASYTKSTGGHSLAVTSGRSFILTTNFDRIVRLRMREVLLPLAHIC